MVLMEETDNEIAGEWIFKCMLLLQQQHNTIHQEYLVSNSQVACCCFAHLSASQVTAVLVRTAMVY